ncbi:histidine phosphatase family protein [Paenibacillus wynnii]|uniref:histidine phosphatase family protein n=1 Tax=Paenibacillus wynnii TaxID=268407 RepID=UPI002794B816|nr:histidine phosphatase family protein [Paenibacillus wynnii]MDQ0196477.1 alpha-ribazole phosphatase [Paenibacillus wynnii]
MKPNLKLELVLLRHGSTQWNVERRYLGHTDLPLLPGSMEQFAQQEGNSEGLEDFWRVYSSDLTRCRQTLACSMPALREMAVYDNRLREMNFGDWEGLTYDQLKGSSLYRNWLDDPKAVTPPNGESWKRFEERVDSFLLELVQAAEEESVTSTFTQPCSRRVLIVTHGGVIRQLLARTQPGLTFRNAPAPQPGIVTVIELTVCNGQWAAERICSE